jgi:23S rRNA (adenine2503-C2)-methyltransferase
MTRAWEQPAPELVRGAGPNVAGMGLEDLRALVASMGESAFRAAQIHEGLYRHRWTRWEQFTSLSMDLRARLQEGTTLAWPEIVDSAGSDDGSTKHAFRLADGSLVEGVHMPYLGRTTLCLSSQVGCAMGCTFCATGLMGIKRNLTAGEIVGQVVTMLGAHGHAEPEPVNLVFMGMGEPLHNLDQVMAAFHLLTDPRGMAIPPRRITLSTSGLVSGIQRLGAYGRRPRLALSLNATTDAYRDRIMPVNRAWNLAALAAALKAFPLERGERITLEYVLLRGVTDSLEDGRRLAAFAHQFPSKVNLIPFNPHEGSGFAPPTEQRISELLALLASRDITVSVRRSRGQDVAAACGQLVKRRP